MQKPGLDKFHQLRNGDSKNKQQVGRDLEVWRKGGRRKRGSEEQGSERDGGEALQKEEDSMS